MYHLVAITFAAPHAAEEAVRRLRQGSADGPRLLANACIAERGGNGALQVEQITQEPAAGAFSSGSWHRLASRLLGASDALAGAGIPVTYTRALAADVKPGGAALLALVEDRDLPALGASAASEHGHLLPCPLGDGDRDAICGRIETALVEVPNAVALEQIAAEQEERRIEDRLHQRDVAEAARRRWIDRLRTEPLSAGEIEHIMRTCQEEARRGHLQALVLRFPSEICLDHGRAINNADPSWPEALTGQPRAFYDFWRLRLAHAGYQLNARVLDYPDGIPGDIGMVLTWGHDMNGGGGGGGGAF